MSSSSNKHQATNPTIALPLGEIVGSPVPICVPHMPRESGIVDSVIDIFFPRGPIVMHEGPDLRDLCR